MAFPKQYEIEIPLLKTIDELGGSGKTTDIYPRVVKYFPQLTEEDLLAKLPNTPTTNKWQNLVQWCRQGLVLKGEIDGSIRGIWKITAKGKERIKGKSTSASNKTPDLLPAAPQLITLKDLVYQNETEVKNRIIAELKELKSKEFGRGEMVPLYVRFIAIVGLVGAKLIGFTGGAFMLCTREAFLATGGFDERLYWSEENTFAMALKREGRFVVLWHYVLTSGRRFRAMSGLQMLAVCARTALSPSKMTTRRTSVEKVWYDSNRANDDKMPGSLGVRVSNFIALVIIVVLVTGPVWNFIPLSWMPWDSLSGKFRFFICGFLCHVGLILWPCAFVLFRNLLRQKRWTGLVQSTALIAFCLWQAWGVTHGVIRFWPLLFHRLAHLFTS